MSARLLQGLVSEQALRRPDATAIVMGGVRLTYAEVETSSNQLARALHEAGCARGDRVCLCLPKSPWAILAMLAVLKAGCIYVPIDITSPARRVARILASCDPACILAATPAGKLLDEVRALGDTESEAPSSSSSRSGSRSRSRTEAVPVGWLDRMEPLGVGAGGEASFALADVARLSSDPLLADAIASSDPAHILFTSGSTGQPKGVVITHDNVLRFVDWAVGYFGVDSSDRTSGHSPLHFDLSTFDVYGTFAAGAALHLVPPERNLLPNKLAEFIRESALTQWFSVPSALGLMAQLDVITFGDFPSLRRVLWCGEVLPTKTLAHWMQRVPHATFTNLYGPTEATIASSYYTVPACPTDEQASIPIGRACDGEELFVLDDKRCQLPPGEIGQLYIGGAGLSPGYWRDAAKTREAFVAAPLFASSKRVYRTGDLARLGDDGLIYFVGRADTQIKSRGYRIELGEVESAASTLDRLRECAVVALDSKGFEGAIICCAYALAGGDELPPARIRAELGKLLPAYMLPSRWMRVDALPRNANGKVDRRALKELFERHDAQTH